MKFYKLSILFFLTVFVSFFTSCEDETTSIGSVISTGEVQITVDTIIYQLNAKSVEIENFDSKTGNLMIGSIQVDSYGTLECDFVTKLMCAANLGVPDSLFMANRVDSCKLILGAERDAIIGDSLAPQKLTVYKLTKQLPSDINNTFNPDGYYNPGEPFASRVYTVSGIAETDSAFYNNKYVDITMDLPVEFGRQIFDAYKNTPEIFQWPQTMAKEFLPGFYVKPTFGNGCVANINSVYVGIYYHSLEEYTEEEDDEEITKVKHVTNLAVPFTVSPEVLSSNNITYIPSENIVNKNSKTNNNGEVVVTTPGGYISEFNFPAQDLINRYREGDTHVSTVNDLLLRIPGEPFDEASGIGIAETLLMIKSSEYDNFFTENKVPDNLTSFTGVYDSENKIYRFTTMRSYFLDLLQKDTISEEDVAFMLVPVEIETETSNSYYSDTTYVTKCVPYTSKPTMTLLKTNEATIYFSFSSQLID